MIGIASKADPIVSRAQPLCPRKSVLSFGQRAEK